jgi:hypothetical protein
MVGIDRDRSRTIAVLCVIAVLIQIPGPALAQQTPFHPILALGPDFVAGLEWFVTALGIISLAIAVAAGVLRQRLDLASIGAVIVGALLVALAGPITSAFVQQGEIPSTPSIAPLAVFECVLCDTINTLGTVSGSFRETAFSSFRAPVYQIFAIGVLIDVMIFSASLFIAGGEAMKQFGQAFLRRVLWYIVPAALLIDGTFVPAVLQAAEQLALSLGAWVFEAMRVSFTIETVDWHRLAHDQALSSTPGGGYGYLWANVELVVWPIFDVGITEFEQLDFGITNFGNGMITLIALLALVILLGLVMLIFAMYLVQLMFYFLAIEAAAPLLMIALIYQPTRGIVWAAGKFLLGGVLTTVFASLAMGFTGAVIMIGLQSVWIDSGNSGFVGAALVDAANASPDTTPNPLAENDMTTNLLAVGGVAYWEMLLIASLSIMLHLNAPKVASNLAGSNDSATNAALGLAAGQYLLSRSASTASSLVFGNPIRGGGAIKAFAGAGSGFASGFSRGVGLAVDDAGGGYPTSLLDRGLGAAAISGVAGLAGRGAGAAAGLIGGGLSGLHQKISQGRGGFGG